MTKHANSLWKTLNKVDGRKVMMLDNVRKLLGTGTFAILFIIALVASLAVPAVLLYVAWHFISKYW